QILKEKGWLGRKSGRGFYVHGGGAPDSADGGADEHGGGRGAARAANAEVYRLVSTRDRVGVDTGATEARLLLPMIKQAARCLEDGFVRSPAEVDLAMVLGTGFPPFRGGLLRHADRLGIAAVVHGLEILAERQGARFLATRALLEMARSGRRFYEA